MELCVQCRHGNACPWTGGSDLLHEIINLDDALAEKVEQVVAEIKAHLESKSAIKFQFDLHLSVSDCQVFQVALDEDELSIGSN